MGPPRHPRPTRWLRSLLRHHLDRGPFHARGSTHTSSGARRRAQRDYCRVDQLGRATGWLGVGDAGIDYVDAWTWRDHSWGVRPGVGGADPVGPHPHQGEAPPPTGSLFIWLAFEAGSVAGQLQTREAGDGSRVEIDGHIVTDTSDPTSSLSIADIAHDITFVGSHTDRQARLAFTTGDRRVWSLNGTPRGPRGSSAARATAADGTMRSGSACLAACASRPMSTGSPDRPTSSWPTGPPAHPGPGDRRRDHPGRRGGRRPSHRHRHHARPTRHTRPADLMMPDVAELRAHLSAWLGPVTVTSVRRSFPGHSRGRGWSRHQSRAVWWCASITREGRWCRSRSRSNTACTRGSGGLRSRWPSRSSTPRAVTSPRVGRTWCVASSPAARTWRDSAAPTPTNQLSAGRFATRWQRSWRPSTPSTGPRRLR